MKASLVVCAMDSESNGRAEMFASENQFIFGAEADSDFLLEFSAVGVRLLDLRGKKPVAIKVDFTAGTATHRMKYGGGKSQAIAKAVGVTAKNRPRVLDACAGLGQDAFVLASLGCEVLMLERSPVVYALLEDGLMRARSFVEQNQDEEYQQLTATLMRMVLQRGDSLVCLRNMESDSANVVYLDPMFPERKKSAQVKKEMLAFQELIGKDQDSDLLLEYALDVAENRVVVKRPNFAPRLAEREPSYQLKGKSSRFDIYAKKKMDL